MATNLYLSRSVLALQVLLVLLLVTATSPASAWGSSRDDAKAIAQRDKYEQIKFWEGEVTVLRNGEMSRAYEKLYKSQAALDAARRKEGFFYTRPEDKATIRLLDEDYRRTLIEVNALKEQERLLVAKLKPLYGVVSLHFAQEQKQTIAESIKTVQSLSYDNAWYSSLFELGDAESFSDVIVGFLGKWLIGFILMYPFALLYYALWAAPMSVYAYTAGIADLVPAVVAYAVCVLLMALPLMALAVTSFVLFRRYRPQLEAAMRQSQAHRHYHQD